MFMFMQYVLECMSQCWPCNNLTAQDGVCDGAAAARLDTPRTCLMTVYFDRRHNTTDSYNNRSTRDREGYQGYATIMESSTFRIQHSVSENNTLFG